jgi:hypothetical protein
MAQIGCAHPTLLLATARKLQTIAASYTAALRCVQVSNAQSTT